MRTLTAAFACLAMVQGAVQACETDAVDADGAGKGCVQAWMDANLRLNDLQVIATHNSYKRPLPADALRAHRMNDPAGADGIDYGHRPLSEQLERGVRGLELDVFYDPRGGHYRHDDLPAQQRDAMARPGFKVMHLSDIDYRSNCQPFVECLRMIRAWSLAHPRHVPIVIQLNAKDDAAAPDAVQPLRFDSAAFDALDGEIRSVFPPGTLITPDQVQGTYPTLREAVLAGRWPTLGESRGKVLFALDESESKVALYRGDRTSLQGRAMFVNVEEGSPAAAWLTLNEPVADARRIDQAVAAGFLVRTRADADTAEARNHDIRRRDAALAGGAQVISTDYIEPEPRFGDYRVQLPAGAVARCNPRRAARRCAGYFIEESP